MAGNTTTTIHFLTTLAPTKEHCHSSCKWNEKYSIFKALNKDDDCILFKLPDDLSGWFYTGRLEELLQKVYLRDDFEYYLKLNKLLEGPIEITYNIKMKMLQRSLDEEYAEVKQLQVEMKRKSVSSKKTIEGLLHCFKVLPKLTKLLKEKCNAVDVELICNSSPVIKVTLIGHDKFKSELAHGLLKLYFSEGWGIKPSEKGPFSIIYFYPVKYFHNPK